MEKIPHDNTISDEGLMLFFDAKESGKSFPDALLAAGITDPTIDLTELKLFWDMHGSLTRDAHNISPDSRLLTRTLESLTTSPVLHPVTTSPHEGYTKESKKSVFNHLSNNFNAMMQMNWKIGAPIAVLLIVVTAVAGTRGSDPKPASIAMNDTVSSSATLMQASSVDVANEGAMGVVSQEVGSGEVQTFAMARSAQKVSATPVSGEISDLTLAILLEANGDAALLDDSFGDISLVSSDSQSITDFNTAYDETTF